MDSSRRTSNDSQCPICLNSIQPKPTCQEEEKKVLDCSHIFHRECIGEWLKRKHNCPICRAHVEVSTPESPRPEMTLQELLGVPDVTAPSSVGSISINNMLPLPFHGVLEIRTVRLLNVNENTPGANTARKVNSAAAIIFGQH
jgi:hypothetical protein